MELSPQDGRLNLRDRLLVGGTWALVIVGMVTMYLTHSRMKEQVQIMKDQNRAFLNVSNQGIRPFALLTVENGGGHGLSFRIGPVDTVDGVVKVDSRAVESVTVGSDAWKARTVVNIGFDSLIIGIRNTGRTPLYVTGFGINAARRYEWIDSLSKSVDGLCREAASLSSFSLLETDYIVLPDSVKSYRPLSVRRTMPVSLYDSYCDSSEMLPFYPYVYLQYKDPWDNKYDVILMMVSTFAISTTTNPQGDSVTRYEVTGIFTEKLRWDILYPTRETPTD